MIQIIMATAPLFLIIFVSALFQKFKNIGSHWSGVLNDFALHVGLPVLIFSSLIKTHLELSKEINLLLVNSIFLITSFLLAFVIGKILKLKKKMFRTLFICFAFGNIAYLGIPVLTQLGGEGILPLASLIIAVHLFWRFTVGIGYLDYATSKNKRTAMEKVLGHLFKNSLLMAVILGLMVNILEVPLPTILIKSLDMINASVTPTVLIVIGLFIGQSKFGHWKQWISISAFSIVTLLVLPGIFYLGLKAFGFMPSQFSSSILEAAMPLAITPFALADEYNLDREFIARSLVMSTILSVFSLPFWISILV